jgi:HK97 gp10 family phage protein
VGARLEGFGELSVQIKQLAKACKPDDVEEILVRGARVIVNAAKAKAPQGPTGNLKRAIKVKRMKPRGMNPAPVLAAVDRRIAPHADLVENGHALVRRGKVVGHVPAHPYFRPAVDETEGAVTRQVIREIEGLIEKAVK